MIRAFLAVAAALILLPLLSACDGKSPDDGGAGSPAPGGGQGSALHEVAFIEVQPVSVSQTRELPGRVVSFQVAEIRPQVSGIIEERLFEAGAYVEEGQQLYQIDPARFEVSLQTARADLDDARAEETNALSLVQRYEDLLPDDLITQQQYDDTVARLEQAKAAVSKAQAGVDSAEIDLEYTRVRAPLSGTISPSNVTRGGLVSARQAEALTTIRQLDPVYVDVTQPAAEALSLQDQLQAANEADSDPGHLVRLYVADSAQSYSHEGRLNAIDPVADVDTGAIRLRFVFPNPDNQLVPGMFVRVAVERMEPDQSITVPQEAVNLEEDGSKSVWIIDEDETASRRSIRTGEALRSDWIVLDGLEAGDRVIVEGTMSLREGIKLAPEPVSTSDDLPEDR